MAMRFDIAFFSHSVAAFTFGLLTIYLLASLRRQGPGVWLIVACAMTTLWALIHVIDDELVRLSPYFGVVHTLLNGAWMAFLMSLLCIHWRAAGRERLATVAPMVLAVLVGCLAAADLVNALDPDLLGETGRSVYTVSGGLALSMLGLVMVENVYFSTLPDNRWSIKFLCFALGGLFAFDFFIYADAMVIGQVDTVLMQARGAVSALVVPLIMISAARNPNWSLDVFFSRRFAVRLFALAGSLLYLLVLVGLGSLADLVGGSWGVVLRTVVLFGGSILLVAILVSGRFRSELVLFLNKNFFTYKFDYREEWLRFLNTVSNSDENPDLAIRVIKGVANIVDSPSGVLWTARQDNGFAPAARWNFQQEIITETEPKDGSLPQFLRQTRWILNLNEREQKPKKYSSLAIPEWLSAIKGAWLIVPLFHREALSGFIVLIKPRAARETNWEDYDLLKTVSAHSASYLAEQETEKALAEVRQFDAFNRRFAFIIHDIKGLVSQLSLLIDNAERHGEDPEFRRDMVATVRGTVSRLNLLLSRLHGEGDRQYPPALLSLPRLVERTIDQLQVRGIDVSYECRSGEIWVTAYRNRLASVFRHLIQNAIDVLSDGGHIDVAVRLDGGTAVVDIIDNGPGMTREFVQNELFQPFKTTKPRGYGIGAYEAREIMRELGGQIEVDSTPGQGTRMSVRIPIVSTASNLHETPSKEGSP